MKTEKDKYFVTLNYNKPAEIFSGFIVIYYYPIKIE